MKTLLRLLGLAVLLTVGLHANSSLPMTPAERMEAADATGLAELVTSHTFRDDAGVICTRFTFRTTEALRGTFPTYFKVVLPGAIYQGEGNADSRLPNLSPGKTYLLDLVIHHGQLRFAGDAAGATAPSAINLADLRDHAATLAAGSDLSAFTTDAVSVNYSVTASGLLETSGFRRFTSPDRDEPIPVFADVSTLPSGISEAQAITALQNALAAWEAVSSLKFSYLGTQTFAQSADAFGSSDGLVLRVQMHDAFNQIDDASSTLGFGGAGFSVNSGDGGTIGGNAFNPITYGYVVLNHPKSALGNAATLEEVLTHEIGHVIGLAHSSETSPEPDATRAGAIMYFQAHADGRGATLNTYDTSTALLAYPANTPPYGFDRVIYAVTSPTLAIANPEVNQVTLTGNDLQGDTLTLQIDSQTTSNGTFTVDGSSVRFTPSGFFSDANVANPLTGFFGRLVARLSDGVNLSPFVEVRVVGFRADTRPNGAPDGLPDSWVTTYFGSSNGSTAAADPDGDGLDNLTEFRLGTDPTDPASKFQITAFDGANLTWTTRRFDTYKVQSSTDLTTWVTERFVTQPDDLSTLTISDLPTATRVFFRVIRQD